MPKSVRAKTNWGFSVALGLSVVMALASLVVFRRVRDASRWVEVTQEVRVVLGALDEELAQAQDAVREYVITGNDAVLEPLSHARDSVPANVVKLERLIAGNQNQVTRLAILEPVVSDHLATLDDTREASRPGTRDPAALGQLLDRGDALLARVRTLLHEMEAEEENLLWLRTAEAGRLARITERFVLSASLLGTLVLMTALIVVNRDLTARARAAAALAEAEVRSRAVLETVADGIITIDERGVIESMNPAVERIFGWTAREAVGKDVALLMPEPQHSEHDGYLAHYVRTGDAHILRSRRQVPGLRKDGSTFPLDLTVSEVRIGNRRLFTRIVRDVSERKRLEDTLRSTLELQQGILDSAANSIISTDPDGTIRTFNDTAERWLGYSADDLIGKTSVVIMHDRNEVERRAAEISAAVGAPVTADFEVFAAEPRRGRQSQREWTYIRKDGSRFPVLLSVAALRQADGSVTGFLGVASDLSAQKAVEAAHRKSESRYQTVVELLSEGLLVQSASGEITETNASAERILGCARENFIGRPAGETPWQTFREDGAPMPQEERPSAVCMRTGQPVRNAIVGLHRSDGSFAWILVNVEPLAFGPDGRPAAAVSSFSDITDIKRANAALERARDDSERANRAKSDFLANMSHELRTPLNSVIGFASVLLKNKAGTFGPQALDFLRRIQDNGKHLLGLINSILDLSKIEAGKIELEMGDATLDKVIDEALSITGEPPQGGIRRVGEVELRSEVPAGLRPLRVDGAKLKQVLINLVGNALKFTKQGSVTLRVVDDPDTHQPLRVDVVDTGIGIPLDRQAAIFEAFQQADSSTSRQFGGTGLGLAISRSLLHLMGYDIRVASEPGKGATFSVLFTKTPAEGVVPIPAAAPSVPSAPSAPSVPSAAKAVAPGAAKALAPGASKAAAKKPSKTSPRAAASAPAPAKAKAKAGAPAAPRTAEETEFEGRTVLVIDDEADSRLLLQQMIGDHGARVVLASSGDEGLRLAHSERPDLITVDLMMPGMNGWEVALALRADPDLKRIPTVVVSVIAEERGGTVRSAEDLLNKPVSRDQLVAVLRRHLVQAPPAKRAAATSPST